MPQSLVKNYVHIVCSTKYRQPFLFSALYFLTFIIFRKSMGNKICFVILGVPIYESHVFTRKEE